MRGGSLAILLAAAAVTAIGAGKLTRRSPSEDPGAVSGKGAAAGAKHGMETEPVGSFSAKSTIRNTTKRGARSTEMKLREIQVPVIDVEDVSVAEFVADLGKLSIREDKDPGERPGVEFRLFQSFQEADPSVKLVPVSELRIKELKVRNVSLEYILGRLCEGEIRYEVRNEVVWIFASTDPLPKDPPETDMPVLDLPPDPR